MSCFFGFERRLELRILSEVLMDLLESSTCQAVSGISNLRKT